MLKLSIHEPLGGIPDITVIKYLLTWAPYLPWLHASITMLAILLLKLTHSHSKHMWTTDGICCLITKVFKTKLDKNLFWSTMFKAAISKDRIGETQLHISHLAAYLVWGLVSFWELHSHLGLLVSTRDRTQQTGNFMCGAFHSPSVAVKWFLVSNSWSASPVWQKQVMLS